MTTKKKDLEVDAPEVVESDIAAEVENESAEAERRTFTIEVNGEDVELVDMWDRPGLVPPVSVLMANPDLAVRMASPIIKNLIGEDQMVDLLMMGATQNEVFSVVPAWLEMHNLKN